MFSNEQEKKIMSLAVASQKRGLPDDQPYMSSEGMHRSMVMKV